MISRISHIIVALLLVGCDSRPMSPIEETDSATDAAEDPAPDPVEESGSDVEPDD